MEFPKCPSCGKKLWYIIRPHGIPSCPYCKAKLPRSVVVRNLAHLIAEESKKLAKESIGGIVTFSEPREALDKYGVTREEFDNLALEAIKLIPDIRVAPAPAISEAVRRDAIVDPRGRHLYFILVG